MAKKIYHLEGIKNPIEWDGLNPPRPFSIKADRYLSPLLNRGCRPGYTCYQVRDDNNRRFQISESRLHFILRNGITLAQCRAFAISTSKGGVLRKYENQRRYYSAFDTLADCQETLDIIKFIVAGNEAPYYSYVEREKKFIRWWANKAYHVPFHSIDLLWDDAVENVLTKLKSLRYRQIRKLLCYVISELFCLHKKRRTVSMDSENNYRNS